MTCPTRRDVDRVPNNAVVGVSEFSDHQRRIVTMQKQHTCSNTRNLPAQAIMLTVDGVATLLACSPRTVYRLADEGRIPRPVRIGGMIRWSRELFEQWIADGCPVPTEGRAPPKTGRHKSLKSASESP